MSPSLPPGSSPCSAWHFAGAHAPAQACCEQLAQEVAIAFAYNGISHAVMMASPLDLEDFALGFSLSEGILDHPSELYELEVESTDDGLVLQMRIAQARAQALKERRRSLAGRTGCGLCGVESLTHVLRPLPNLTAIASRVRRQDIHTALAALAANQRLNHATGAVHAAALAGPRGLLLREDVGRHNALDKLIGARVRSGRDAADMLLLTSRASHEMVAKAAFAGLPVVIAISAPTALAVRQAQAAGITLAGYARADRLTLYAHPERVV